MFETVINGTCWHKATFMHKGHCEKYMDSAKQACRKYEKKYSVICRVVIRLKLKGLKAGDEILAMYKHFSDLHMENVNRHNDLLRAYEGYCGLQFCEECGSTSDKSFSKRRKMTVHHDAPQN